ncbi:serine hydrolase domain-containing protein [Chlorogloeopsis sp. ULAP01]|uniref:serine hydrolase domain-containing protein n=1 Tax=Chlorogloeopsis sp. ULAP01 TaxID=3056483 RepID=UPI0025AB32C7|nr:serine hydrolase domain-containing protein [Chlorogloeopsis sp. ULAP01]MDM9380262.1 serine hydrolase domain-containing protein [Chlorogloeopsis sp. ULAP01]
MPCIPPVDKNITQRIQRVESGLLVTPEFQSQDYLHAKLIDRMNLYNIPGVSIAVINNYTVEWERSYGEKEAGKKDSVTEDTLFQACSLSKPVAAVAALRLVEEGFLDLGRLTALRASTRHFRGEVLSPIPL